MRFVLSLTVALSIAAAVAQASGLAQSKPDPTKSGSSAGAARPSAPAASKAEFARVKAQAEAARDTDQVAVAIGLYSRLVEMRPDWAEGWWHLGALQYDVDDYRSGAVAFAKFVLSEPENGQGWGMLGLCEFRLKNYLKSLQHLTKARSFGLGGNEELARVVRYHQALLLNFGNQFEAAKGILTGFAVENRESPPVLDALGMSVLRISRPPEELTADERSMVREFGRAAYLEVARQQPDAIQLYEQLAAKHAGKPNVAYAYGSALAAEKQGAKAIEFFEQELRLDPSHVGAMLQLAFELSAASRLDEALSYAQKAAKAEPDNPVSYYIQGRIFVLQREIEKAIRVLEKARGMVPESSQVRYMLAQAYQRGGREADAQKERAEFQRLRHLDQQRHGGQLATYMPGDNRSESEEPE
jgi:tetratricopeptide (TPR) repeat protein